MPPEHAKREIDHLTESFFALFSNRNGAEPDLRRIHDLVVPEGVIAKCVDPTPEISNLEEFIAPRQELLTRGPLLEFAETEISEETQIFGHIAHRLSTYEKSGVLDGVSFTTRGVKSFQFIETAAG
jgi:hypothetical protein